MISFVGLLPFGALRTVERRSCARTRPLWPPVRRRRTQTTRTCRCPPKLLGISRRNRHPIIRTRINLLTNHDATPRRHTLKPTRDRLNIETNFVMSQQHRDSEDSGESAASRWRIFAVVCVCAIAGVCCGQNGFECFYKTLMQIISKPNSDTHDTHSIEFPFYYQNPNNHSHTKQKPIAVG